MGAPPPALGHGPDLHVLSTYPPNGAGTECRVDGPDDCGVPVDAPIELRFDRYLLPKSATRQALLVYSGRRDQAVTLQPDYDVVERVVTYRTAFGALLPGLLYEVELVLPAKSPDGFGFQAFDGAPLVDDGAVPLDFSFRTARAAPVSRPPGPAPSCHDAVSIFVNDGCTGCHAGPTAALGLRLDSGAALRETAISRVAREAEGPNAENTIVDPLRFGVGMPLIDPGAPGSSYLLYKLLTKAENFGSGEAACRTVHLAPLSPGACLAAPPAERARLEDWFVRLDPMPPGRMALGAAAAAEGAADGAPGAGQDLRALADFIGTGASTSDCN